MISFKEFLNERVSQTKMSNSFSEDMVENAVKNDFAEVRRLVLDGYDVDSTNKEYNYMTPLMYACYHDEINEVKFLLEHGANINAKDVDWDTPLHFATLNGYVDMVDYLLSQGAEIDIQNKEGKTPIDYAKGKIQNILLDAKHERGLS